MQEICLQVLCSMSWFSGLPISCSTLAQPCGRKLNTHVDTQVTTMHNITTDKNYAHHCDIREETLHKKVAVNRRMVLAARGMQTHNILRPSLGQELE